MTGVDISHQKCAGEESVPALGALRWEQLECPGGMGEVRWRSAESARRDEASQVRRECEGREAWPAGLFHFD